MLFFGSAVLWLYVWSTPLFSESIVRGLENNCAEQSIESLSHADTIVILGGCVIPGRANGKYPELNARADRIFSAIRIFNAGKASSILISGGPNSWSGLEIESEAHMIRNVLIELGIPENSILTEERSRNTGENAQFCSAICESRGITSVILVTSAMHMPRAMLEFQHTKLTVHPFPTDYEAPVSFSLDFFKFVPTAGALENGTAAFHERLGMFVRRAKGLVQN